jgi:hypothetical protein
MVERYETLLVISGVDLPPWSAFGIQQSLRPISQGVRARRTVNGDLINLAGSQFAGKYVSEISCDNRTRVPALDGVYLGQIVTVDCVAELAFRDDTDAEPTKEVVPDSERTEGDYVFYRPRLEMMIIDIGTSFNEVGVEVGWRLMLEEV